MTDQNTQTDKEANIPQKSMVKDKSKLVEAQQPKTPKVWLYLCLILVLLFALLSWRTHMKVNELRQELAQRLQKGDEANKETKIVADNVQDDMKNLQSQINEIQEKQSEAQSQFDSLQQLHHDLSKTRDEAVLLDLEQTINIANQQLLLAGNVPGALLALQDADRNLARINNAQFLPMRKALAQDLNALKNLPNIDLSGLALRLDDVLGQIEKIPLLSEESTVVSQKIEESEKKKQTLPEIKEPDWFSSVTSGLSSWLSDIWDEIRQLVRVRKISNSDVTLASPEQGFFIRENLRLRLLGARLSLLSRNEATLKSDLNAAQEILKKYFDQESKNTQNALATLTQIRESNLSVEIPPLTSLEALNKLKTKE